jgi:hypothetical protein
MSQPSRRLVLPFRIGDRPKGLRTLEELHLDTLSLPLPLDLFGSINGWIASGEQLRITPRHGVLQGDTVVVSFTDMPSV